VVVKIIVFRDVIPCIFLTTKLHGVTRQKTSLYVHYVHKRQSLVSILSYMNLVHSLRQYYCNVLCSSTLQSKLGPVWQTFGLEPYG
jgi:hypothetical protein